MSHHDDDVPYIVIERSGSGFMPFLWGALAGAVTALLLAPKSGAETQRELKERAQRLREAAEEKVGEFQDSVQGTLDEGRDKLGEKLDSAKQTVQEGRQRAQQAFDAGRDAAKAARNEFEDRVHTPEGGEGEEG